MGDSITYGCGYNAVAPNYGLECTTADGSYRVELDRLLRAAGKPVEFIGSLTSNTLGILLHHEGHVGISINQTINLHLFDQVPTPPDHVLVLTGNKRYLAYKLDTIDD